MKKLFAYSFLMLSIAMFMTQCKSKRKTVVETTETVQETKSPVQRPGKDYIPVDDQVKIGKLPNGMTYYIRKNKKPANKVELRLALKVGSILEDDDQQGLAHFMEHMNFNGLKHFPKNELVDFLQKMGVRFGADLNAFTSFDRTVYMLPIPLDKPENLDKGLLVIHDWAYFANLTPEEIDKERGVVLEELRMRLGASKRMMQKWLPVALKDSKYAKRLPIGKKEILETFPYSALKRFHKDWYRPDLEAIFVVGDIDPDEVERKIKKMFSDIPAAENPRKRPYYPVPNHKETLIATAADPEANINTVQVIYKDRDDYKKDETVEDYVNYLKTRLFSTMLQNRLDEIKESDNPPFSFAFVDHGLFIGVTKEVFSTTALTQNTDQLTQALETILREHKKIKEFGFTQQELERAKKQMLANVEEAYNNRNTTESRNLVWQYINHFTKGEPIPSVQWEYDMYKYFLPQIKLSDVNALSKEFIHDDNRVVIITGKGEADNPPVKETEVKQIIDRIDAEKVAQQKEEKAALALMKAKPQPGKIIRTETNEALGTKTYYLDNGAIVTAKKTDFKEDEVRILAFKFGGNSVFSNEELKKTVLAIRGVPETGVNGLSNSELKKVLTGKKADIHFFVDNTSQGFQGETRPKDLETWMQLQYLYFTKPNKDEKAFGSWFNRNVLFMMNFANSPQMKFIMAYNEYLNGKDPRYIPPLPTKEIADIQDYSLAYDKFRELFDGAGGFFYYIVGNFDEAQLENYIKTYIASLPSSKLPSKFKTYPDYKRKGINEFIFHAGKDPKSMVIINYYGSTKYSPREKMYLKALGEIMTNKLIERIREAESGVYGIRASGRMNKLPHETFGFSITFPCGPDNARTLAAHSMEELQKIIDNGPTQEDLDKIKKSWLVKFEEDKQTNSFWTDYLSDTDYLNLDPGRIFEYETEVKRMKTSDIQEVAKKYLAKPKNRVLAIQFPEGYKEKK